MKELLKSFHLNGHTLGFHPQTQNVHRTTFIDSRFDSGSESKGLERFSFECRKTKTMQNQNHDWFWFNI